MFFLAFILLILLVAVALVIVVQNFALLFSSSIHLTLLSWHLPGIPLLVLCLLGACLGGLLLYVVSSLSARRDARELKKLRTRVKELRTRVKELEEEKAQATKPTSGPLPPNFAPPAIPLPGFAPTGPIGPSGPLGQRLPPPNSLQNLPPSASGNNLSLPPRQFPPLSQTGAPQPPFPRQ